MLANYICVAAQVSTLFSLTKNVPYSDEITITIILTAMASFLENILIKYIPLARCVSVGVCRYVGEECLEVEVWSCPTRGRRGREGGPRSGEPPSEDSLLGTASISLEGLLSENSVRCD